VHRMVYDYGSRVLFLEHDRTRRVDKNFEKFRRYDTFLCWWWQHTSFADGDRPYVMFICQDEDQRDRFLAGADDELAGQLWHQSAAPDENVYMGRQRVLFACVAVGKTGREHAGSLVRVGSENGHLVRRTQAVRCEDVVHRGSEVRLRNALRVFSNGFIRQPHASSTCTSGGWRRGASPASRPATRSAMAARPSYEGSYCPAVGTDVSEPRSAGGRFGSGNREAT
jgi:hypothetical protein